MSSSLAVLLEVKTTHSSVVLSLHLSQCFTPPLKSIPASFFPHAPCPPSWIPSLPAILTPVLRMCHLFKTTYATLGACLSTDPIWWGNFLRRGKPLMALPDSFQTLPIVSYHETIGKLSAKRHRDSRAHSWGVPSGALSIIWRGVPSGALWGVASGSLSLVYGVWH